MFIEAYKDGDKYILPIKGAKKKIKVEVDEEEAELDLLSYVTSLDSKYTEVSKEEYREKRGEYLWREYLLLDEETMKEKWMELSMTHEDPNISDDDLIERAHANWDKDE
jgi:hypothetical protein